MIDFMTNQTVAAGMFPERSIIQLHTAARKTTAPKGIQPVAR